MAWVDFRSQEPNPLNQFVWGITGERDQTISGAITSLTSEKATIRGFKVNPSQLRLRLVTYFNLQELKTLCFDLGEDYEQITGEDKDSVAREIILYFERRNRLGELIDHCRQVRPKVQW